MVLYVDGGCSANGQLDMSKRRMVAVVTDEDGIVLNERQQAGGSNNIAELIAVRDALVYAREHGQLAGDSLEIRTDSQNTVAWVFSKKIGKKLNDRAMVEALRAEISHLRANIELKLVWIRRDDNLAGHYIEETYGV